VFHTSCHVCGALAVEAFRDGLIVTFNPPFPLLPMPYDPTLPQPGTEMDADQMRAQFNGLKALIDAVSSVTSAVVDAVNTLPPGSPAAVTVSLNGGVLHLSFDLPQGSQGAPGAAGQNGSDGSPGPPGSDGQPGAVGPPGPPFAQAVVDAVTTLNPGEPATVQTSFDGSHVRFTFGIPRGSEGPQGPPGSNGSDGMTGPPGPPFTNFVVDAVNMLNPMDPASAQTSFDGSAVRLVFNLPRGLQGDAGNPGTDGMAGPPGPPFTNFVVDNVTQLPPGSWPNVSANYDGNAVRLNFGIPQGAEGPQGIMGPQGPPFGGALVDGVTTLNPWDNATVNTSFDGSNVRFTFGIPRGQPGNDGSPGPPGPPGEVTNAQLSSAINGTSNNSNGVNTLNLTVSDPPTQGEVQAIAAKLDELINALRR
jgi:hypothetical protein